MLSFFVYPGYGFAKIWIFQIVHDIKMHILENTYFLHNPYFFRKPIFRNTYSLEIRIFEIWICLWPILKSVSWAMNTYFKYIFYPKYGSFKNIDFKHFANTYPPKRGPFLLRKKSEMTQFHILIFSL